MRPTHCSLVETLYVPNKQRLRRSTSKLSAVSESEAHLLAFSRHASIWSDRHVCLLLSAAIGGLSSGFS